MWWDRGYSDGSTPYTWLSSITLPPWLPGFPPQAFPPAVSLLGHLPAVNSRPHPGIALQSLCSSPQPLQFLGDLHPCVGYVGPRQGLSVRFSLHSACQRSAAALSNSLKCFSSVPNNFPDVEIWSLVQFPNPSGCRSSPAHSLLSPLLP